MHPLAKFIEELIEKDIFSRPLNKNIVLPLNSRREPLTEEEKIRYLGIKESA